jgi:immune inhibitor A
MHRKIRVLLLPIAIAVLGLLGSCSLEEGRGDSKIVPILLARVRSTMATDTLARLEEAEVPQRDPIGLAQRLRKAGEIPLIVREVPYTVRVGDKELFWALNLDTNEYIQVTAVLQHITPHLYVWVEEGAQVDLEALRASAERFETDTYPTTRRYFGDEWSPGVDGDIHLNILHARGLGGGTAAYFSSSDEFSRLAHPYSNEREMFYANLDGVTLGSSYYDGVLAHEFQHMIHWQLDRNEELWLNEGFSKLATYLNGYDPGSSEQFFLARPDLQLNSFSYGDEDSNAHYGAAYLFALYFLDRFGEEATRALVAHAANGPAGIDSVLDQLGENLDFETLFADWAAALYLDNPALRDGRYGFLSVDIDRPALAAEFSSYPVEVTDTTVHQFASDYIRLAGTEPVTVIFTGTQQVPLIGTPPHGGASLWWSNRGDDIDTTLTRRFDFTGLRTVTLDYWLWYDVEEDWDYAYLEVSSDDGRTWDTIQTAHTSEENPAGNNYGHGYTGRSGGEDTPQWIHEQVDLSAYAGQSVLIRFEYITDGAIHHPGLALDDFSIPELGCQDGFEAHDPAWQGAGFVRSSNVLPQRFALQLIELGAKPRVRELPLNDLGHARWRIPLNQEMDEAILIISGVTPVTLETASYAFQVVPD